jgi:hypothetical protein
VGWTEIPRYSFKVPEGWGETPVSIADLGGTEVRGLLAPAGAEVVMVVVRWWGGGVRKGDRKTGSRVHVPRVQGRPEAYASQLPSSAAGRSGGVLASACWARDHSCSDPRHVPRTLVIPAPSPARRPSRPDGGDAVAQTNIFCLLSPPQIDLRFADKQEGNLMVVVAPVAR